MTNAIRWTPEMLQEYRNRLARAPISPTPPAPAPGKYASKKVERAGEKFDSKKEARRWEVLLQMQAAGQISDLRRQVPFVLAPAVRLAGEARMKPALRYFADAVYQMRGDLVVEDTKSTPTRKKEAYRIKKHLMATVHNIHIREI